MKRGLTKSQLGFYFMPKYLKYFEEDCYIDYGNGYYLKFYSLQSIKATMQHYNISTRNYQKTMKGTRRVLMSVFWYLDPTTRPDCYDPHKDEDCNI